MQRHHRNPLSATNHAVGVLGRLMRAFPARTVVDADVAVDAVQQPAAVVRPLVQDNLSNRAGLLGRLESWIWRQQQRERESYLAEATDIADLEARMRVLEIRQLRNHSTF